MDVGRLLLTLVVLFVAARLAAEVAERIRQPAVLAEIVVGVLIGPSALGLVRGSEDVALLAELGVILLLFEVGRQTDLRSLARVGRSSVQVACIGVAVPMALGSLAMWAVGLHSSVAIFLGAGITATSVGITARVFGDLRALSTTEARIVLGAAVTDDVIGLVVLALVIGTSRGDAVRVTSLLVTIGAAMGFLLLATVVGWYAAPKLLNSVQRWARTEGTVMAVGLCIALGFAALAESAHLAPIVGAFVAGIAVSGSDGADDLHRRLAPLGQLLIPVFFLQIGIQARLASLADPWVLGVAGLLTIAAVTGKVAAGFGVRKGTADRLLVGAAMIPRGEVGLIFATLGLAQGVLDARTYAVLLLVVLASTLITPPWIRNRIERTRRAAAQRPTQAAPAGGWLVVGDDEVELAGDPAPSVAGEICLDAALLCSTRRPGPRLVAWLSGDVPPVTWDASLRSRLFALLEEATERSWRFLEITRSVRWLLPDLDAALQSRPRDPFDLDPAASQRFGVLDGLRVAVSGDSLVKEAWEDLRDHDVVLLAAMVRDLTDDRSKGAELARRVAEAIGWNEEHANRVAFLVAERDLLPASASNLAMSTEHHILDFASFVETGERLNALYVVAVAENALEPWQRERLDEFRSLSLEALSRPELTGPGARAQLEARVKEVRSAMPELGERAFQRFVEDAPRRYLLVHSPETITRHLRMTHPKPGRFEARLKAEPIGSGTWIVHIVIQDRPGALALIAAALAVHGVPVTDAVITTWADGMAIDVFRVVAPATIHWERVRERIEAGLETQPGVALPDGTVDGTVRVDGRASPWHSIVEIRAADRTGLLARVASAMSRIGLEIHEARVATQNGVAVDSFWVTGPTGHKLTPEDEVRLREALTGPAAGLRPGRQKRWVHRVRERSPL